MILYLNEDWDPSWGGCLELWEGHTVCSGGHPGSCIARGHAPRHVLSRLARSVPPELGTLVVFETSERSYHEHPEPVVGPRPRLSLATYYYTARPGIGCSAQPHSTVFVARPGDVLDPETESLRAQRNAGRLATQVVDRRLA